MVQSRAPHKKILIIIIVSLIIISFSKFDSSFFLNYNQIDNSSNSKLKISNSPTWDYKTSQTNIELVISSDGNYILVGGDDITDVYLFHRLNSSPVWSYELNGVTFDIAISSDGKYFVIGSNDNKIYFFDRLSPIPLWTYTANDVVMSVAISSDGNYIVAGGRDDKIYLFSKNSSTPIWSYTSGSDIFSVAISSDGNYIVAGGHDTNLYLFNKNSSTPIWSYDTDFWLFNVAISSDGNYIVTNMRAVLHLFNRVSSSPLWNYSSTDVIISLAISSDGNYIAVGDNDQNVYLFNRDSSTPLWSYLTNNQVLDVAISSDGNYIVAGSRDYNVYLFSVNSSKPLRKYNSGEVICSVDISSDGSYIVAGSWEGSVFFFNRLSWKVPFDPFYLNLFLVILIPIVILMVLLGVYLILRKRIISTIENKRELSVKKYTEMGKQSRFRNLKCIRCGTKEGGIFEYKSQGIIPTCVNCRNKFQIWRYSKIPLIFLTIFTIITFGAVIFLLIIHSIMPSDLGSPGGNRAQVRGYIQMLILPAIILLICTCIVIILRRIFGSKLKHFFKDDGGAYVKSITDVDWLSYRDWIDTTLLERNLSENEITLFIQNEGTRQQAIKGKNIKIGKKFMYFGGFLLTIGLISLIYGFSVVALADIGPTAGPYVFVTVHLPGALTFIIPGIVFLVIGIQKKKFLNLK